MKIEQGTMRITDVPYVAHIDVNNTTCEIRFTGLINPIVFTKDELQEFHAALTEALKYSAAPFPATVRSRVWRQGDPEPTDITSVIDCDGDRWERNLPGLDWRFDNMCRLWEDVVGTYGPVQEWK